ncbi:hypothetical protein D3C75_677480 [compost metagenome]
MSERVVSKPADGLWFPAISCAIAISDVPGNWAGDRVIAHFPSASAMPRPSSVVLFLMMTVLPTSAVPLTTVPSGTKTVGAAGGAVSTVIKIGADGPTELPAGSVAPIVSECPFSASSGNVTLQVPFAPTVVVAMGVAPPLS